MEAPHFGQYAMTADDTMPLPPNRRLHNPSTSLPLDTLRGLVQSKVMPPRRPGSRIEDGRTRRGRDVKPTAIGDLLKATPIGRAASSVLVSRALWEEVAGVGFARRTKPDRLERGTLYILCASSGWAQELTLHSTVIVQRLKERGLEVERIRFKVAEVEAPERGGVLAPSREELARARTAEPEPESLAPLENVVVPALRRTLVDTARAVRRRAAEVDAHERAARDRKPRVPGKR